MVVLDKAKFQSMIKYQFVLHFYGNKLHYVVVITFFMP